MLRLTFRSMLVFVGLVALVTVPIARARSVTASIRITNNSSRTIRNVYLSHVDVDDWGNNQLGDSTIGAGQSFTISNLTWDQQQVKVIAEDQDGCFLSAVVPVEASAAWTITNETAADCGGSGGGR